MSIARNPAVCPSSALVCAGRVPRSHERSPPLLSPHTRTLLWIASARTCRPRCEVSSPILSGPLALSSDSLQDRILPFEHPANRVSICANPDPIETRQTARQYIVCPTGSTCFSSNVFVVQTRTSFAAEQRRSPEAEQAKARTQCRWPRSTTRFLGSPAWGMPCKVPTSHTRTVQSLEPEYTVFGAAMLPHKQRADPRCPGSVATRVRDCRSHTRSSQSRDAETRERPAIMSE